MSPNDLISHFAIALTHIHSLPLQGPNPQYVFARWEVLRKSEAPARWVATHQSYGSRVENSPQSKETEKLRPTALVVEGVNRLTVELVKVLDTDECNPVVELQYDVTAPLGPCVVGIPPFDFEGTFPRLLTAYAYRYRLSINFLSRLLVSHPSESELGPCCILLYSFCTIDLGDVG